MIANKDKINDCEEYGDMIHFNDLQKNESLFFMMYVAVGDSKCQLFIGDDGQPVVVTKEMGRKIADKLAQEYMLLRPGSDLFQC